MSPCAAFHLLLFFSVCQSRYYLLMKMVYNLALSVSNILCPFLRSVFFFPGNNMLHPVVPAVVCGISAVGILITVVLLCRHLRKRKHRTCVSTCGYDAIGDCKPPSLMSVTPSTSQVLQSVSFLIELLTKIDLENLFIQHHFSGHIDNHPPDIIHI